MAAVCFRISVWFCHFIIQGPENHLEVLTKGLIQHSLKLDDLACQILFFFFTAINYSMPRNYNSATTERLLHLKVDRGTSARFSWKVLNRKIKVDWLVGIGELHHVPIWVLTYPHLSCISVSVMPVLYLEIARISSDRQEQGRVRPLKSAQ